MCLLPMYAFFASKYKPNTISVVKRILCKGCWDFLEVFDSLRIFRFFLKGRIGEFNHGHHNYSGYNQDYSYSE